MSHARVFVRGDEHPGGGKRRARTSRHERAIILVRPTQRSSHARVAVRTATSIQGIGSTGGRARDSDAGHTIVGDMGSDEAKIRGNRAPGNRSRDSVPGKYGTRTFLLLECIVMWRNEIHKQGER